MLAIQDNQCPSVAEIMSRDVVGIPSTALMKTAANAMAVAGIRHLAVVDDGKLVAVVSQRDLLAFLACQFRQGLDPARSQVADFMNQPVKTINPEATVTDAAKVMIDEQIGCLPVTDGKGRVIGIVTRSDIMRHVVRASEYAALLG
jgi:acetoin utilization protein AcuB